MQLFERINVEQGTDEWKALRRAHFTASNAGCLFGANPYKTALQYAEEMLAGVEPVVTSDKAFLYARGHEAEAAGRVWTKENLGLDLPPAVVRSTRLPALLASLDGLLFNDSRRLTFEAKYMGRENRAKVANGEIPPSHAWQVQAQLYATGADECLYFAMDPDGQAEAITIKPDDTMQAQLSVAILEFMAKVRAGELPAATDRDVQKVSDPRFDELARLHRQAKAISAQYDALEETLLAEFRGGRLDAGQVAVTRYFAKGSVDYAKVPQLKGVDLDRYRKAGQLKTKVTIKKESA